MGWGWGFKWGVGDTFKRVASEVTSPPRTAHPADRIIYFTKFLLLFYFCSDAAERTQPTGNLQQPCCVSVSHTVPWSSGIFAAATWY